MHRLITIDGVDGVGKTTIAKKLAEKLKGTYYKSPGEPFQSLRSEIDKRAGAIERYAFYRIATAHDSRAITDLLQICPVVCDRYIYSTIAYHSVLDNRVESIIDTSNLIEPSVKFLLTARSDIRSLRLRKRAEVHGDFRLESDSSFLDRVALRFLSMGLIEIDTSDLNPDDVVMRMLTFS